MPPRIDSINTPSLEPLSLEPFKNDFLSPQHALNTFTFEKIERVQNKLFTESQDDERIYSHKNDIEIDQKYKSSSQNL